MEPRNTQDPDKQKVLPPVAGGAPLPGDALLDSTAAMGPQAAAFVEAWVEDWRSLDQETGATEPY